MKPDETTQDTMDSLNVVFKPQPSSLKEMAKSVPVGTVKLQAPKKGMPKTQVWIKVTDDPAVNKKWVYWKMISDPLAQGLSDGDMVYVDSGGKVIGKSKPGAEPAPAATVAPENDPTDLSSKLSKSVLAKLKSDDLLSKNGSNAAMALGYAPRTTGWLVTHALLKHGGSTGDATAELVAAGFDPTTIGAAAVKVSTALTAAGIDATIVQPTKKPRLSDHPGYKVAMSGTAGFTPTAGLDWHTMPLELAVLFPNNTVGALATGALHYWGNNKIDAIRAVRAETGLGLKESKDAVEAVIAKAEFKGLSFGAGVSTATAVTFTKFTALDLMLHAMDHHVRDAILAIAKTKGDTAAAFETLMQGDNADAEIEQAALGAALSIYKAWAPKLVVGALPALPSTATVEPVTTVPPAPEMAVPSTADLDAAPKMSAEVNDATMKVVLKNMGFEANKASMLKDPKFVAFMLKNFGAGWFAAYSAGQDKPKKQPKGTGAPTPAITTPPTVVAPNHVPNQASPALLSAMLDTIKMTVEGGAVTGAPEFATSLIPVPAWEHLVGAAGKTTAATVRTLQILWHNGPQKVGTVAAYLASMNHSEKFPVELPAMLSSGKVLYDAEAGLLKLDPATPGLSASPGVKNPWFATFGDWSASPVQSAPSKLSKLTKDSIESLPLAMKVINKLGIDLDHDFAQVAGLIAANPGILAGFAKDSITSMGIDADEYDAAISALTASGYMADLGGAYSLWPSKKAATQAKENYVAVKATEVPPPAPAPSTTQSVSALKLTKVGAPSWGGAGAKLIYKDQYGQEWLFKLAVKKGGGGGAKPQAAYIQAAYSKIAKKVVPNHVHIETTTLDGKFGTIQQVVPNEGGLKGVAPSSLTTQQKKDIATEHVLDWLMSQHDSHGQNLLRRPDGTIIGVDKEQGFKYFPDDKLDIGYHPNAQHDEAPPYYNQFWGAFASNKLDFDPLVIKDAVEKASAIPDAEYREALQPYAQARTPGSISDQENFLTLAVGRKQSLRQDFEGFITKLYRQRTGEKKGSFTFDQGWTTSASTPAGKSASETTLSPGTLYTAGDALGIDSASVYHPALVALAQHGNAAKAIEFLTTSAPAAAGLHAKRVNYVAKKLAELGWTVTPPSSGTAAPVAVAPGLTAFAPLAPTTKGAIGVLNAEMVLPAGTGTTIQPQETQAPPTPAGFPEPEKGKMWEVMPLSTKVAQHFYKMKDPKKADGSPDPGTPIGVLKLQGLDAKGAKELLEELGVTPQQGLAGKPLFNSKDGHVLVLVNREEWEKQLAAAAKKKWGKQVPIPPPPPPPGQADKFHAIPKAGELKNPVAVPNLSELDTLTENKGIGYGKNFMVGGTEVEQLSMSAQRMVDPDGKTFYRFQLRLRAPTLESISGGKSGSYEFRRNSYDAKQDAWVEQTNDNYTVSGGKRWSNGDDQVWMGTSSSPYSFRGTVIASVYEDGKPIKEKLAKLLDKMQDGLSEKVLKTPTSEEQDVVKLSALLWSVAPKQADALKENERNSASLKAKLTKLGYGEEHFQRLGFEVACMDKVSVVMKGRGYELAKKWGFNSIVFGCSTEKNVVNQVISGALSITQRLQHGVGISGKGTDWQGSTTSAESDIGTGGGDSVYVTLASNGNGWPINSWGNLAVVMDPSELDRLDIYQAFNDNYGNCDPNNSGHANGWLNRKSLEEANPATAKELLIRRGISNRKMLKVLVSNQSERAEIITALQQKGITQVNGMNLDDFVLVRGNSSFHKTQLVPAGY